MQNERKSPPPAGGLNARDLLLIVFKHKWKIIILTVLGLAAAAVLYKQQPIVYASKAKIFVRYLVEREVVDDYARMKGSGGPNVGEVIYAEIELITSRDIALDVVDSMGPEKLIPGGGGGDSVEAAAGVVSAGLEVAPMPSGNVLQVTYQNENPEIVKDVLSTIIEKYKAKHFAVHRASGSMDFVTKRVDIVRMRMAETQKALDDLREKAGVISLPERRAALDKALVEMEQQLLAAEGDLAVQKAVVAAAEQAGASALDGKPVVIPPPAVIRKYRTLLTRVENLLGQEAALAQTYLDGHASLRRVRGDIEAKNAEILKMETEHPGLLPALSQGKSGAAVDPMEFERQRAILEVIQGKVDRLNARIAEVREEGSKLREYGPRIAELERRLQVDEESFMYFQNALEKARVDEALDPSRAPNLEVIQHPTPPSPRIDAKMQKIILAVAGSGLGVGLGLAFLIELLLNRGIRKPLDLETELQIPLLLAIPKLPRLKGSAPLLELKSGGGDVPALMMADEGATHGLSQPTHFIQPYTEAIRDRLVFHFELHNMRHKPKLVAFTGLSDGSGTSTLAAGLAQAFAEEDDAKVLLVDMNSDAEGDIVYNGVRRYSLPGALGLEEEVAGGKEEQPAPDENLVIARARSGRAREQEFAPRSLYELMPNMRASDYDYIIFDMPPVGLMSPTLAMAGLMDKVLLVLDSEKTDRDVLRRRYSELASGKAHVSCIYNKAKRHAPKWIQGDL